MRKVLLVMTVLFTVNALSFSVFSQDKKNDDKTKTFTCWASMTCENCKAKIEKNIAFEKGVKDMQVDLPTKTVTIKYNSAKTNPEKLEKAIKDLGFKTEVVAEKK